MEAASSGWLRSRTACTLRTRFVEAFSRADYRFLIQQDSGCMLHLAGGELTQATNSMFQGVAALASLGSVVGYFAMAATLDWKFTMLTIIVCGLPTLVMNSINRRSKRISAQLALGNANLQGRIAELFQNIKYLLATHAAGALTKRIGEDITGLGGLISRLGLLSAWAKGLREPLLIATITALVWIQFALETARIEAMFLILLLFYRSISSVLAFQVAWQGFLATSGSIELVRAQILELENHPSDVGMHSLSPGPPSIEFNGVSLKLRDSSIINNFNLSVAPGEWLAILGPSGSGKSTLVNLVTGLMKPDHGDVMLSGRRVSELNPNFRTRIGYITQEYVVFNDTLANNLSLWAPKGIPDFWHFDPALTFVGEIEQGLAAILGDRGVSLSGGQRQRLCIARELLKECDLLILDEALNSLDPDNEDLVIHRLRELKGQITILMITHHLKHATHADRVALLELGRLRELGAPDALLADSGSLLQKYRIAALETRRA